MTFNKKMQAIPPVVIGAAKESILAVRKIEGTEENIQTTQPMSRTRDQALKQPTFDRKALDKCTVLHNFEIDVRHIFLTKSHNNQESGRCQQ